MRWPQVELREVLQPDLVQVRINLAETYGMVGVYSFGRGLFRREPVQGSNTSYKFFYRLKADHFVMSQLFGWEGALALSSDEFAGLYVSPQFPTFLCDENRLDYTFLKWIARMPSFWDNLATRTRGMGDRRRTLNPEALLSCKISLPSLDEQSLIVSRIEEVATKLKEADELRMKSAEQVEALYRSELAAVMRPHDDSWEQKTVADVILSMGAGWSPQCENRPARGNEWGVLKTTAVQWCEFSPEENKALPLGFEPRPELVVSEGDVLVTRAGPTKRVGVVAAVRHSHPRLTISDKLIRLRPDKSKVDWRFLELSLTAPFSQEYLMQRKTGLADAQVNISQEILRNTPIAYPRIPEQRRIIAHMDSIQAKVNILKKLQAKTTAELDALMPSILSKAFRGEL